MLFKIGKEGIGEGADLAELVEICEGAEGGAANDDLMRGNGANALEPDEGGGIGSVEVDDIREGLCGNGLCILIIFPCLAQALFAGFIGIGLYPEMHGCLNCHEQEEQNEQYHQAAFFFATEGCV